MKYDSPTGSTTETNVEDEGVRMGIDSDNIAHIISVVTDLYSDPVAAVIREYSTNARDAQVENGNGDQPINVFLPTEFVPVFEVVDRGIGMDAETLRTVYGRYGTSTKRDSDDYNGMLGLGCKSALTYTSQFTVVSTKDGVATTAVITRDEDGVGRVRVVSSVETGEANGTSVQVPVTGDVEAFSAKAQKFYRYWNPGEVLVDGKAPVTVWEAKDALRLDDDVLLFPSSSAYNTDRSVVVMGGVAYPLDYPRSVEVGTPLSYGTSVVARLPIGAVNIAPSREALTYSAKTEAIVTMLAAYVRDATRRRFEEAVARSTSAVEAVLAAKEASRVLAGFRPVWMGHEVCQTVTMGYSYYVRSVHKCIDASFVMRLNENSTLWNCKATSLANSSTTVTPSEGLLLVTDFPLGSVSKVAKAKVAAWMEANDVEHVSRIIFRKGGATTGSMWVDGHPDVVTVSYEDVKATALPASIAARVRPSSTSRSSGGVSTAAPADDLSEVRLVDSDGDYVIRSREWVEGRGQQVIIMAPSDLSKSERGRLANRLSNADVLLLVVNKNRHEMALGMFAHSHPLAEAEGVMRREMKRQFDGLSLDGLLYLRSFEWNRRWGQHNTSFFDDFIRATQGTAFANSPHIKAMEAVLARVDAADRDLRTLDDFLYRAQTVFGYDRSTQPVWLLALRGQRNEVLPGRVLLSDTLNARKHAFEAQYPLYTALRGAGSEAMAEYVRLLDLS